MFFFFKQKTAYEMRISDWSSDVCSSDLTLTALWYLTGWQQAPGALLIGSGSIAFFGGADEAGAAIAQFARFAAIAAVAAPLLCHVLLPLAGDSRPFLVNLGVFMVAVAAWSGMRERAFWERCWWFVGISVGHGSLKKKNYRY